ncbi:MAG: protein kinase [Myxococcota bacterium]
MTAPSTTAKCPNCDRALHIGQRCPSRACKKRGYHGIPVAEWARAHEDGAVPDPYIGTVVGDFLIVEHIGAGGFGKVFRALQAPLFSLQGALKLLDFDAEGDFADALPEKFEGEAKALAQINHPNVVQLLKYGRHDNRPYLVMEFLDEGLTLADEFRRRLEERIPLDRGFVKHVLVQVLHALNAAHNAGIVHRDIKPDNIMLQQKTGHPYFAKLLDFGIAKSLATGQKTQWLLGTPSYMAPEQIMMTNLGPWTDLYAVGVMTYWMLTGLNAYPGESPDEILSKKISSKYDPLHRLAEVDIPKVAEEFLRDALARNPEDRISSALEFEARLEVVINVLDEHSSSPAIPRQDPTTVLGSQDIFEFDEPSQLQDNPTRLQDGAEQEAERQRSLTAPSELLDLGEPPKHTADDTDKPSHTRTSLPSEPTAQPAHASVDPRDAPPARSLRVPALLGILATAGVVAGGLVLGGSETPKPPAPELVSAPEVILPVAQASESLYASLAEGLDGVAAHAEAVARAGTDVQAAREAVKGAIAFAKVRQKTPHIVQMSLGKFHACALLWDGRLRCWGDNSRGQLGVGQTTFYGDDEPAMKAPIAGVGGVVREVAVAGDRMAGHTCALLTTGNVRCFGENKYGQLGYGYTRRVGDDELPSSAGDVQLGARATALTVGGARFGSHSCALTAEGRARCWGSNKYGQLGYGHTDDIGDDEVPASAGDVSLPQRILQLVAGKFHTCALLENRSVSCWGWNERGQLGRGHTDAIGDDETPGEAPTLEFNKPVMKLAVGRMHSCALMDGGAVRCWGWNEDGQLGLGHANGLGDDEPVADAMPIDLDAPAIDVVAGDQHSCALLKSGKVRCWGDNRFGQLGYGHTRTIGSDSTPATQGDVVLAGAARSIYAGSYFTCALLEDDSVSCWGQNQYGQLGYGHKNLVGDNETPLAQGPVKILDEAPKKKRRRRKISKPKRKPNPTLKSKPGSKPRPRPRRWFRR